MTISPLSPASVRHSSRVWSMVSPGTMPWAGHTEADSVKKRTSSCRRLVIVAILQVEDSTYFCKCKAKNIFLTRCSACGCRGKQENGYSTCKTAPEISHKA